MQNVKRAERANHNHSKRSNAQATL